MKTKVVLEIEWSERDYEEIKLNSPQELVDYISVMVQSNADYDDVDLYILKAFSESVAD